MIDGISDFEGRITPSSTAETAAPPLRSEREFARARRHSRVVTALKFGLPLTAIAMVLVGVGYSWLARAIPGDLSMAAASIQDGRLVMQDPRLSGSDSSDRPYSMIAQRAIQSLTGSGVDLEGVRADVAIDDQTNATINATNGRYDPESEQLQLFDDISVDTTSGISIRLSEADIDLAAGRMLGRGPVTISTPSQRLESGSVSIEDGGSKLSFGGRVKLTLLPNAPDGSIAEGPTHERLIP